MQVNPHHTYMNRDKLIKEFEEFRKLSSEYDKRFRESKRELDYKQLKSFIIEFKERIFKCPSCHLDSHSTVNPLISCCKDHYYCSSCKTKASQRCYICCNFIGTSDPIFFSSLYDEIEQLDKKNNMFYEFLIQQRQLIREDLTQSWSILSHPKEPPFYEAQDTPKDKMFHSIIVKFEAKSTSTDIQDVMKELNELKNYLNTIQEVQCKIHSLNIEEQEDTTFKIDCKFI